MPRINKESQKEYAHQWRLDNKERLKVYQSLFRLAHPKRAKEWRALLKKEVLGHYSFSPLPKCARCGIEDVDVLCIDHINGGGTKHLKSLHISAGTGFYSWLKKKGFPEEFQVLCANCNLKKQVELERGTIAPRVVGIEPAPETLELEEGV